MSAPLAEVLVVAAVAQLAVLPGEKVQFIIAALSTRYHPLLVVSAAASAFAGWTALEILFGRALQTALPPAVLDGITAALFLLFAVLLYRSAPAPGETSVGDAVRSGVETDGGAAADLPSFASLPSLPLPVDLDRSDRLGAFVPIFAMMAAGEFGDKTQLVTIGLAVQYGAHPGIWLGEMLVIVPVSLANAYLFHRFSHRFDVRKAHFLGAGLFLFFGLDTVLALTTGFSVWETLVGAVSSAVLSLL